MTGTKSRALAQLLFREQSVREKIRYFFTLRSIPFRQKFNSASVFICIGQQNISYPFQPLRPLLFAIFEQAFEIDATRFLGVNNPIDMSEHVGNGKVNSVITTWFVLGGNKWPSRLFHAGLPQYCGAFMFLPRLCLPPVITCWRYYYIFLNWPFPWYYNSPPKHTSATRTWIIAKINTCSFFAAGKVLWRDRHRIVSVWSWDTAITDAIVQCIVQRYIPVILFNKVRDLTRPWSWPVGGW